MNENVKKPKENVPKNVSRAEYYKTKRADKKFEMSNYNRIVMIPCSGNGGWYEMGDNSALLYKYVVCEPRGIEVVLMSDEESYNVQFAVGVVRSRGPQTVRSRIIRAGLYASEVTDGSKIVFVLKKQFPQEELRRLRAIEKKRQEDMKNIAKVEFVDPVFYRDMSMALKQIHDAILNGTNKLIVATIGGELYTHGTSVLRMYLRVSDCSSKARQKKYWAEISERLIKMLTLLQIMADQKILDMKFCAKIGEVLTRMKERAQRNYAGI